ncbi:MAG: LPS export ABC transporter periplasmic protein LptC [Candidatus Zapsychrus exili]|nr:LPS export ABC transporter periplasmic protein LptC [Candidatus Zapsychrus exili]
MWLKRILLIAVFVLVSNVGIYAQEVVSDTDTDKKFQGFNLQGYTEEGEKSWDVNGDTADIVGTTINLSNVDANSYGEQKVNLKAGIGVVDQISGNMHLETDVVITSEEGQQLTTDSLDWDKNKDLVSTEDDVLITDEGFTLTGTGLEATPGLNNAQVNEDVTVMVDTKPEEEDKSVLTITCDGPMIVDRTNSVGIFNKNVVAIQKDRTLKADKMEVYFSEEMKKIKKVICIGNVAIIQGENQTFSDRAVYDAIEEKITLSGRPKLILLTEDTDVDSSPRD